MRMRCVGDGGERIVESQKDKGEGREGEILVNLSPPIQSICFRSLFAALGNFDPETRLRLVDVSYLGYRALIQGKTPGEVGKEGKEGTG